MRNPLLMSLNWQDPISRPSERICSSKASQKMLQMLSTTTAAPVRDFKSSTSKSDRKIDCIQGVSECIPFKSLLPWFSDIEITGSIVGSMCSEGEEMWGSTIFLRAEAKGKMPVCKFSQPIGVLKSISNANITTTNLTNTRVVSGPFFKL